MIQVKHRDGLRVNSDISYSFSIQPSKHKPRVTSHEIITTDTTLIEFNEEISMSDAEVEVYTKDTREAVKVSEYFLDASKKVLVVKVPFLNEEEKFYTICLQNIKNRNGIFIDPNPRELTLVYRSRYFRKNIS